MNEPSTTLAEVQFLHIFGRLDNSAHGQMVYADKTLHTRGDKIICFSVLVNSGLGISDQPRSKHSVRLLTFPVAIYTSASRGGLSLHGSSAPSCGRDKSPQSVKEATNRRFSKVFPFHFSVYCNEAVNNQ